MNLAIRGIEANLGPEWGDSFHDDKHPELRADFILANPPFNISNWGGERLIDDKRWKYGTPPHGNANYAWLQHMLHHLAPTGTMGVVLASEGYPGSYPKGRVITGIEEAEKIEGLKVFQAGTALDGDTCTTSGGRVLCVTALGKDLAEARDKAYQGVAKVHFDGMYFRRDIGEKGLRRDA